MLQIANISRNNLQNVSTKLPKHAMTVVTGVAVQVKVHSSLQDLNVNKRLSLLTRNLSMHQIVLIYLLI